MKSIRRGLLVAAVVASAGLATTGGATAQQGPAAPGDGNAMSEVGAEAMSAGRYWTPARMAAAKPLKIVVPGGPTAATTEAASSPGESVVIPPASPASALAAEATAEEAAAPVPMAAASAVPRPYTDYPDKINGKVFFTKSTGGNFVCSGTAVNTENKSVVWTAGHCVHGGRGGGFHRNWVFVPAYSSSSSGHRPFGTWTAKELWTRTEWIQNSNFRQDFGAVVVNRLGGTRLVDRLGAHGIAFNQVRSQFWSAFGYPASAPFNGLYQYRCNSGRLADDFPPGAGPGAIKLDCNMTGGASGGGWIIRFQRNGLGTINGLNSYKYSNQPQNMYGPYHGNEGLQLFNAVRNRPA